MKAVFSFWNTTGNALERATNWKTPKFHLYSWVLAVHRAAMWYEEVELVTDSVSLPMFEKLKLPFTRIRTDLDELKDYPKSFWSLGKIKAYQIQDKPFIHIDNDVILYRPLPTEKTEKPLLFQNKEAGGWFEESYRGQYENLSQNGRNLPKSWGSCTYAFNFGIYGCNDMAYNERYCKEVFELVDNNTDVILDSGHPALYCVIFEQYMGAAVANEMGIEPTFLSEPFIIDKLDLMGYIHIWGAKHSDTWYHNIEHIVNYEHPEHYEIIREMVA